MPRTFVFVGALAAAALGVSLSACDKTSTTMPSPPDSRRPVVSITSVTVSGERAGASSFIYHVTLTLSESGGVDATIAGVDLTFMNGATPTMTTHHDKPLPGAGSSCPARGSATTRELVSTDANAASGYATTVQVRVAYTDGSSTWTASSAADVPPPAIEPTPTYTLVGFVTDENGGRGIQAARVEVLTGVNAGKSSTADAAGSYAIGGLLADTFRLRASADGYAGGEQTVTVPAIPRADFQLRSNAPCAYSIDPIGPIAAPSSGGPFTAALTRTSGGCAWQATTDAPWIAITNASGGGSGTLAFTVAPNMSFTGRYGVITVAWGGGSAQLAVTQANTWPDFCVGTITVNGQNSITAPAAGGQFTAAINSGAGMPPGICGAWTATADPPITFVGPASGPTPGSVTFDVQANTSPNARTLSVVVRWGGSSPPAQLTVYQGTP